MARTVLNKAAAASDNLVKIHYHEYANMNNVNAQPETMYWRTNAFTTTTSNADLIVEGQCMGVQGASDQCGVYCMLTDNSGNGISGQGETRSTNDDNKFRGIWYAGINHNANWSTFMLAWHKKYTNVPAGTYKIEVGHDSRSGGNNHFSAYIDPVGSNSNADNRFQQMKRICTVWELKAGSGVGSVNMTTTTW